MSNVVKNRYLQLDGTPVECPAWRRYISPLTASTALAGAIVTAALPLTDDEHSLKMAFAISALTVAAQGVYRKMDLSLYKQIGMDNFVIDTKPEIQKHQCTETQLKRFISRNENCALIGTLTNISVVMMSAKQDTWVMGAAAVLPVMPSFFAYSWECWNNAKKVDEKDWIIIDKNKMATVHQTEFAAQPSPT